MARIAYSDIQGQEYALTHNWSIGLPIPSFIPDVIANTFRFVDPSSLLDVRCESVTPPQSLVKMVEITVNGMATKQAMGADTAGELTVVILEDSFHNYSRFFEFWKELRYNKLTGKQAPRTLSRLPRGFFLNLLSNKGNPLGVFDFFNIAPTNVSYPELTGTGELFRVTLTLDYTNYKRRI